MNYQVLARKYRPQRFADVIGQQHATVTLMNALAQNRVAHGYIFSGHRGIGKTTVARILAMALNCRHPIGAETRPTAEPCGVCESCLEVRAGNAVDVIEIDAATNRGIDEIRELRDAARYRPARDRFKIYILDEAHQITDAAFNALLKTLEEPPEHIVFMMATTQPEDIPQTIRSRCQHFSFRAVSFLDLVGELRSIADREEFDASDSVLNLVAEAGDGSVRDALSVLDQALANAMTGSKGHPILEVTQVREMLGTLAGTVFERMLESVRTSHAADLITTVNELIDAGNSPTQIARQIVRYLRSCILAKISAISPDADELVPLLQISLDEQRRVARSAASFSEEDLTRFLQIMLRTFDEVGYRQEPRLHLELGLLKLIQSSRLLPLEQLLSQLPTGEPEAAPETARAAVSQTGSARPAKPAMDPRQARGDPGVVMALEGAVVKPASGNSAIAIPDSHEAVLRPPLQEAVDTDAAIRAGVVETLVAGGAGTEKAAALFDPEQLREKVLEGLLVLKNQGSAADALGDAEWHVEGGVVRVQTALSKRMLGLILSAEVQSLVREILRRESGTTFRLEVAPLREGSEGRPAERVQRPPHVGSAESRAHQHPIVQEAKRLFRAEIRNVIDLSNAK